MITSSIRFLSLFALASAVGTGCAAKTPNEAELLRLPGLSAAHNLKIMLHNDVGDRYKLIKATYILDGQSIFEKTSTGGWTELPEYDRIYQGYVRPGPHALTVLLEYEPNDLGIFTYARGYKLKVRSNTEFDAKEKDQVAVHAVVRESGLATKLEQGLQIAYKID
jgi:hypothetical protein